MTIAVAKNKVKEIVGMSAETGIARRKAGQAERKLGDLISIGPAMLRDFELLGIRSVAQLAKQDPDRMYKRMERVTGQRQDPCVLDTFCAAVAQAKNPRLAVEQCQWWWWSAKRKRRDKDDVKK
jgi:hypothetical protein